MRGLFGLPFLLAVPLAAPTVYEPVGVCSLADGESACWGMSGEPRPDVLARVRESLSSARFVVPFFPGERNRYVFLRSTGDEGATFQTESGEASRILTSSMNSERTVLIRVPSERSRPTVHLTARVDTALQPHDLRFRPGRHADVDGDRVEIGAITRKAPNPYVIANPEHYAPESRARQWQAIIGHSIDAKPQLGLRFVPLDEHGQPILYVDRQGRPVPEKRGRSDYEVYVRDGSEPASIPAMFWPNWAGYGSSEAFRCDLNIDPRFLNTLRVTRVAVRDEDYGQLPLESKRP